MLLLTKTDKNYNCLINCYLLNDNGTCKMFSILNSLYDKFKCQQIVCVSIFIWTNVRKRVRPTKCQISLNIRAVESVFVVCMNPANAQRRRNVVTTSLQRHDVLAKHTTSQERRYKVAAMSRRKNVVTTSLQRHGIARCNDVPATLCVCSDVAATL